MLLGGLSKLEPQSPLQVWSQQQLRWIPKAASLTLVAQLTDTWLLWGTSKFLCPHCSTSILMRGVMPWH
jgi:hypothetical protein